MSNFKSKATENIENLCPIQRKRIKSTISAKSTPHQSGGKGGKFESASSPSSSISLDLLEEMGISVLDTESSNESAASTLGVLSADLSNDENSNEATPNFDAPKFKHSARIAAFHGEADNSGIDNSTDNVTATSPQPLDETIKTKNSTITTTTHTNTDNVANNNNYYKWNTINNNESHYYHNPNQQPHHHHHHHQQQQQHISPSIQQNAKKTAILGMGAGNVASQPQQVLSPSKSINRSPLSVVAYNNYHMNMNSCHTNYSQSASSSAVSSSSPLSNAALPSTSKQAILNLQRQLLIQQQQQISANEGLNKDCFFLYRRNELSNEALEDNEAIDNFKKLSDEVILQIFKWLPKKALLRCSLVCQRFNRCAADESLWSRVDLGGRTLRSGAMEDIMRRGVVVCRLSMAELKHPVFEASFLENNANFVSKLQYLDLSMITISKPSLKLLLSRCRSLRKLSLEHVSINDDICSEIAKNTHLEALNLAMCSGIEAWSVRKMFTVLNNLTSLNISWTNLSVDAIRSFVSNITPNILRLNIAGCRKTLFDTHLATLAERCPQLLELDVSDCISLTGNSIEIICKFKMLEYLSLSRCYLIPASHFMDLSNLPTLAYLDVFGMLSEPTLEMLEKGFQNIGINKFIHSSVARPTVGTRRTAIWGLRTRD